MTLQAQRLKNVLKQVGINNISVRTRKDKYGCFLEALTHISSLTDSQIKQIHLLDKNIIVRNHPEFNFAIVYSG